MRCLGLYGRANERVKWHSFCCAICLQWLCACASAHALSVLACQILAFLQRFKAAARAFEGTSKTAYTQFLCSVPDNRFIFCVLYQVMNKPFWRVSNRTNSCLQIPANATFIRCSHLDLVSLLSITSTCEVQKV